MGQSRHVLSAAEKIRDITSYALAESSQTMVGRSANANMTQSRLRFNTGADVPQYESFVGMTDCTMCSTVIIVAQTEPGCVYKSQSYHVTTCTGYARMQSKQNLPIAEYNTHVESGSLEYGRSRPASRLAIRNSHLTAFKRASCVLP